MNALLPLFPSLILFVQKWDWSFWINVGIQNNQSTVFQKSIVTCNPIPLEWVPFRCPMHLGAISTKIAISNHEKNDGWVISLRSFKHTVHYMHIDCTYAHTVFFASNLAKPNRKQIRKRIKSEIILNQTSQNLKMKNHQSPKGCKLFGQRLKVDYQDSYQSFKILYISVFCCNKSCLMQDVTKIWQLDISVLWIYHWEFGKLNQQNTYQSYFQFREGIVYLLKRAPCLFVIGHKRNIQVSTYVRPICIFIYLCCIYLEMFYLNTTLFEIPSLLVFQTSNWSNFATKCNNCSVVFK